MLGLESLGVRMERHCSNALALAKYLEGHERVEWVNYAALPNDKYNDVCKKSRTAKHRALLVLE
jgi:O-acetylhomoserine (thiol)-lyase